MLPEEIRPESPSSDAASEASACSSASADLNQNNQSPDVCAAEPQHGDGCASQPAAEPHVVAELSSVVAPTTDAVVEAVETACPSVSEGAAAVCRAVEGELPAPTASAASPAVEAAVEPAPAVASVEPPAYVETRTREEIEEIRRARKAAKLAAKQLEAEKKSEEPEAESESEEEDDDAPGATLIRLQKVLAAAGCGSRRHCEELIQTGRVEVDDVVVTELGTRVDPSKVVLRVDSEVVKVAGKVYYAVNKPAGVVCTNDDPDGRPRVVDLLPPSSARLFTVGRLDRSSEGLILVTNDGDLAQQLAHPKFGVQKTYRAQVAGVPSQEVLYELRKGVRLAEGVARVDSVKILSQQRDSCWMEIVLSEGKNREIRRILARVGHKVLFLRRTSVGPLRLRDLEPGSYRKLTGEEVRSLWKASGPGAIRREKPVDAEGNSRSRLKDAVSVSRRRAAEEAELEALEAEAEGSEGEARGERPAMGERRPRPAGRLGEHRVRPGFKAGGMGRPSRPSRVREGGEGERPRFSRSPDERGGRPSFQRDGEGRPSRPPFQRDGEGGPRRPPMGTVLGGEGADGDLRPSRPRRFEEGEGARPYNAERKPYGRSRSDEGGEEGASRPYPPRRFTPGGAGGRPAYGDRKPYGARRFENGPAPGGEGAEGGEGRPPRRFTPGGRPAYGDRKPYGRSQGGEGGQGGESRPYPPRRFTPGGAGGRPAYGDRKPYGARRFENGPAAGGEGAEGGEGRPPRRFTPGGAGGRPRFGAAGGRPAYGDRKPYGRPQGAEGAEGGEGASRPYPPRRFTPGGAGGPGGRPRFGAAGGRPAYGDRKPYGRPQGGEGAEGGEGRPPRRFTPGGAGGRPAYGRPRRFENGPQGEGGEGAPPRRFTPGGAGRPYRPEGGPRGARPPRPAGGEGGGPPPSRGKFPPKRDGVLKARAERIRKRTQDGE